MRESAPLFRAAGVQLAAVVQAPAERIPELCGYSKDLVSIPDPEHRFARGIGLGRMPFWKLPFAGGVIRARRRAGAAGFSQNWKRTFGKTSDALLNPGAAMIECGGKIQWLHLGEHVADLPSASDLLAVAQEFAETKSANRSGSPGRSDGG